MRILIVEDEQALARLLVRTLTVEGHECEMAHDGQHALQLAQSRRFDLVLLDLNLPSLDGADVLEQLRAASNVLIVIVTGRAELDERIRCLNQGADDLLTKPFSPAELRARIAALERRRSVREDAVLRFGDVALDRLSRTVVRGKTPVDLTAREFALLECLLQHKGEVVSRGVLLKEVWGMAAAAETNVLDVYVNYLRRKLDAGFATPFIQTLRGKGYTLCAGPSGVCVDAMALPPRKPMVSVTHSAAAVCA